MNIGVQLVFLFFSDIYTGVELLGYIVVLFIFYFLKIYLFIFGCVGSSLLCAGFSLRWLLLLRSTGSRCVGFSSCGSWAQQLWLAGSRAQAQQLWRTGLVAPRHVGSSRTRAQTHVPCIGRQILNQCATREALFFFKKKIHFSYIFLKKYLFLLFFLAVLGLSCGTRGVC